MMDHDAQADRCSIPPHNLRAALHAPGIRQCSPGVKLTAPAHVQILPTTTWRICARTDTGRPDCMQHVQTNYGSCFYVGHVAVDIVAKEILGAHVHAIFTTM